MYDLRKCLPGLLKKKGTGSKKHDKKKSGVASLLSGLPSRMARKVASGKGSVKAKSKGGAKKKASKSSAKRATPKKTATKKTAAKKATTKKKKTTVKSSGTKPKTARKKANTKKKATTKKNPAAKKTTSRKKSGTTAKTPPKKRRARKYSINSRLSTYIIGDDVIFEQVRDWNDSTNMLELRGTVIGLGHDPDNEVNFIEVLFEIETLPGRINKQVRRFTVK